MALVPDDDLPESLASLGAAVPADDLPEEVASLGAAVPDDDLPSAPTKEKGFVSNIGNLLVEGGEQAIASAKVSPAVISGEGVQDKAGLIAQQLSKPQNTQPAELQEAKGAFKDEGEAWEKSEGFLEGAGAVGQMLFEVGRQAITNPKGLVYLTAEQAANMAPAIVGMITGGKIGAAAGTAVAPGIGTTLGAVGGAATGAFAGQAPLEIGSEFISLVGKELSARGMQPTESNVAALLQDTEFTDRAINDARVKGATTAGIDAALTVASGGIATGPRRIALKTATEELGAGADAAQIAKRASEILDQRTIGQKVSTGGQAVGLDVAGGGLSEAGGQLAAYGQVDLADVGLEMLGEVGGSVVEVPAAAYSVSQNEMSRRRQMAAQQNLNAATNASDAAAAANELAGSVDDLTAAVDDYVAGSTIPTPEQAVEQPAGPREEPTRSMIDRQAGLIAQAQAAGTQFDRQMALDQAQAALPQPAEGRAAGFVDLTPMNAMQAQQRLAVLRDQTAQAGGNALALTIVPHPAQADRFAIAKQALPDLSLPQAETTIAPNQAQFQIESAALGGQVSQGRAQDSATRGVVIDQALKNVEARGGVASPAEARIFQEAGIGQPYDRVDPALGPEPAPLIETAGAARESFTPNQQIADQEVQADQAARRQSDLAQRDRQTQEQIAAAGQARQVPDASAVISALVTPGRERSAEQVRIVNEARNRFSPQDFSILERAATAPFQLNTEERMRLRELRNPPVSETNTNVSETGTGLMGTRVAERLGQPSGGRIVTTNAKLSTQRVAPGATITINDGDTQHEVRVVEPSRMGVQGKLLQQIARLFNKRLVAFESDTLQADGFVRDGDNNSIYVNADSQMSPLAVFGHELTHLLKRDNPEAYAALEAVVQREMRDGAMAEFEQEYGEDANLEEMTSDLVGNRFQEADFWQSVFDEIAAQNPEGARGIIARVAAAINRAINAFLKVIRQPGFQADQYVNDINAVKRAVNQAMTAYMQQPRQATAEVATEVTPEVAPAVRPSMVERLREAARGARQEMGETVTASKARRGGVVEQAGDFTIRTQKDGTLGVSGKPEAIRALLPEGIAGRVIPGGMVFTATAAPRVRAALEGRKLGYSRAGQVTEKLPMKDGKYVGAPEKFNTPGKITQLRKWLNKLAREGEAGRYWYENSSREVLAMVGGNVQEARKFVALLSIYSPQAKVDANSTFALRAWAQYKAGQPISVKTGVQDRKAQEALDDVDAFWSGEKTGNFFFNLLREIDPSTAGRQGATIDMWMMRAGQYSNDAPTATQYAFMENETNRLAQELGWEPQQVQAAIWVAMKARMENAGVKKRTEASSEKNGWIRYEYPLKNGKPRKTRVIVDAQKHRDNWLKHSFEHDPTKDDTQQAKFDFSDGLRRHVGQLSWEARPGRSTNVLPGVNDAPYEQQVEFQQAVQKALLDDNGIDLLAYKLGMLVDGPDILAPGVWQGEIAAGMQKLVALAPAKGDEGKTSIDPAQKKAIETYAATLGLLLRQEGVGYHRPFYSGSLRNSNGVDLNIGRTLSPSEAQSLWAAINERMIDAGVANWEKNAGIISSPTGMRIVNFGAIADNEFFRKLVKDAAETLVVDEIELGVFASDGDLISNDWRENPNGEDYRQRIAAAGSPDLLEWAGTVLAPRVQSVFNEFSARYGWGNPGRVDTLFDQPAAAQDQAQLSRRRDQKNPDRSRVGDQSANRFLRTPELEQAVTDLQEGRITRDEYDRLVDEFRPVYPYREVPPLTTPEAARYALANGRGQSPAKAAKYGLPSQELKKEEWAQLRLDIPSYQNEDNQEWVVSVHRPKSTNVNVQAAYDAGPVVGYESVASLTDVYFGMNQNAAVKIAQGANKGTIATILGKWNPMTNEEAMARAKEVFNDPAWTQVGMDPFRHSYFYDRDTMRPVLRADEVIQIGPLVLAKNVTFGTDTDNTGAPFRYSRQRGINVRNDGDNRYADFIVDGEKTMESRDSDSLRPYVGRKVGIIRTGEGPAKLIGTVKIGEPVEVGKQEFRARESEHLVPEGSEFDIKPGSKKFLYPLTEAERFDDERDVDARGIVAREVQFSRQRTGPFYSQLAKSIDEVPARLETQPAQQWKAWLASNASKLGIKKDEIEWSGINDYLDLRGKEKVSKDELAEYLDENAVEVSDVNFGEAEAPFTEKDITNEYYYSEEGLATPDGDSASRVVEFKMAGGEFPTTFTAFELYDEYESRGWELFIENTNLYPTSVFKADDLADIRNHVREYVEDGGAVGPNAPRYTDFQVPGGENFKELLVRFPDSVVEARNISEYRVPQLHRYGRRDADFNRLLHLFFNDRVDADGNKVMFVEEIQSDWAQEGRKKGFAEPGGRGISKAPFVQDTKSWVTLGVKRLLAYAAENGYDKVAFINGQQAADKYSLIDSVEQIRYIAKGNDRYDVWASNEFGQALNSTVDKQNLTVQEIENFIGKELAQKIVDGKGRNEKGDMVLEGLDLKVGGEGMMKFYDQIVPQVTNDLLKKLGGSKLESVEIRGRDRGGISGQDIMKKLGIPESQRSEYWKNLTQEERDTLTENARNISLTQPGFTITPEMRAKVAEGLPLFSRRRNYGTLTAAQEQALRNVGGIVPEQTVAQRAKELAEKFKRSWFSGIFDQFAPLKDVDQRAYMLARLSKGSDGALEALMLYGKPFMNGDVPDVNVNDKGFIHVMATLKGEHDRFLWWVAAQRAENLKAQGRENLFTDQDISSLKSLNQGNFDDGTPRAQAYANALAKMNEFNDAVLNIAEKSGLIDSAARDLFKDMPYVPFYRVMEDGVDGPSFSSGLVNQRAWKKLKGGTQKLNEDLLSNVLLNWSHLFDAAGKNRAAVASMQAAVQIGIAQAVPAGTKGAVKVMEQGQTKHYVIDDPHVMEAVTALNYQPPGFFAPFSTFKKWLTIGVTASPTFKIKNLMRDSLQAIGTAPMSYNVASNVMKGFKQGSQETQTFASMLAGGGLIRFGSMLEGTSRTQYMIERQGGILLNEGGWKKLQRQMTGLVEAYAELGDRLENVNRVSLYEHLISKGYSQAEANFMSRDLMDFSLQGRWPVVRFLAQSVPFLNARLQGLSKLGRGAKEDPRRFGYVVGAVALASIALMLAYEDDEDWKKRPDWDRDSNWWFKIGDTAFRIPKPFEIGAIGTVAERTWEVAFNDEMSWKRYRQRLSHMIFETFAMDPTPQLVVPISEIYANKEGFTQRPIEGLGLQKLRPEDRATERTSSVARVLGQMGLPSPVSLVKGDYEKLSPVQIDHLIRGYFGWIGTTATTILDFGLRPLMDRGERPAYRLKDVFVAGNFAEGLPANSSRYVDQLYEQARLIEQAYMSYQDAKKKGDRERMRELVAEDGNKIKAYKSINKISRQVSEINRKIRQIESSKTLSADTKRKMIDQLSERKNQVAKKAQKFAKID